MTSPPPPPQYFHCTVAYARAYRCIQMHLDLCALGWKGCRSIWYKYVHADEIAKVLNMAYRRTRAHSYKKYLYTVTLEGSSITVTKMSGSLFPRPPPISDFHVTVLMARWSMGPWQKFTEAHEMTKMRLGGRGLSWESHSGRASRCVPACTRKRTYGEMKTGLRKMFL